MDPVNVLNFSPNLNSVASPVPEIIGGIQKNWTVPRYTHAAFSPQFLMGFCSDGPCECSELLTKFELRIASPVPRIIVIGVFWVGVANPQS